MKIFLKYIFKYDLRKCNILRTCLLIFSIILSTTLFVGSFLTVNSLLEQYKHYINRQFHTYNVVINNKEVNEDYIKYDGVTSTLSYLKVDLKDEKGGQLISVIGMTNEELNHQNIFDILSVDEKVINSNVEYCYISLSMSKMLGKSIGEYLEIEAKDRKYTYIIAGITSNDFLFALDDSNKFSILVNNNLLNDYNNETVYNYKYLEVDSDNIDDWILKFNSQNEGAIASKTYDNSEVEERISLISLPLYFITVLVLMCSIFIIMSSYKMIILDRFKVIGIYLSQGIERWKILSSFILECIVIGIIGGFIGGIFGNGLCKIIVLETNPLKEYNITEKIEFSWKYVAIGMVISIIISIISTIISIAKIGKYSIKDINSETLQVKEVYKNKYEIFGIISLICSIGMHLLYEKIPVTAVFSLIFVFITIINITPLIIKIITGVLSRIEVLNNGIFIITKNQLRNSKLAINDIKLLTVSLTIIFMLMSLGSEMTGLVRKGYKDIDFDIYVNVDDEDKDEVHKIIDLNIEDYQGISEFTTYLDGKSSNMVYLVSVDVEKYKTFEKYISFDDKNNELNKLAESSNAIILSRQIAKKYNINLGDSIRLTTKDGHDVKLEVISICDPKMWRGGNYNIISSEVAEKLFDIVPFTSYYIKATNNSKMETKDYKKLFKNYEVTIYDKEELISYEESNLKQIATMMNMMCVVIIVFAIFALSGNALISSVYRRREMLLLNVLGLTPRSTKKLSIVENISKVVISIVMAIPISRLAIACMSDFMDYISFKMDLMLNIKDALIVSLSILIIYVIISLLSNKNSKASIRDVIQSD